MQPESRHLEEGVLRALRQRRQGAVLVYTGPAGIGKTHAARALLRHAAVRSQEFTAGLPLSEWPARLPAPRALPAWAEAALRRLPDGDGALAALATLIAALAPVGILVDDLHDALPAQQAALCTLAGLLRGARGVALLFTSRQTGPDGLPSCAPEPLNPAGTAALSAQELGIQGGGEGLPREVGEWVHARALGNPLFTLEYLRYLARSGHLYSDGQRWHWRVPDEGRVPGRIEALIDLTLGRAGAWRGVLEARALVPGAGPEVWAQVAGVSAAELSAGTLYLQDQGLLTRPGAGFCHPLYAEVLRAQQTPAGRRLLAQRALQVYRAEPLWGAEFLDEAGLAPAEASALLEQAAAQAQERGQGRRAGELLARASDLAEGDRRTRLALQAAQLLQTSDLPRALELSRRALLDPAQRAGALPLAASLSARTGGRDALEAVLASLPDADLHPELSLLDIRLMALQSVGDHAGVVSLWGSADAARQARADLGAQQAVTISLLAVGRQDEAAARLAALLRRPLSGPEQRRLQGTQVMLLYHQGEYRAAAEMAGEAARHQEDAGNLVGASALWHNRAAFLRMLGEFGEARISVRRALDSRRTLGDPRGYASSLGMLGELELEGGQLDAAEDALSEALGVLTYLDGAHFLLNNLCMLTYLHTLSDAPLSASLARHHAVRALGVARQLGNPRLQVETLADASRAHTRAGDPETGLRLAGEAAAQAAALSTDHRTQARGALARGLALEGLKRPAEALAALEEAEHIARTHQGDYEADRIAVDIARLRGDHAALEELAQRFGARGQGLGALLARRALGTAIAGAGGAGTGDAGTGDAGTAVAGTGATAPGTTLQLRALGTLELTSPGLGSVPVRGERRRALLLRLLEARLTGRGEVTRLDLADDLYPERPEAQALGALKQAVAALRAAVGREVIQTTPGGYALGPVSSDAETFLARPDLSLWRGPLPPEAGEALREALSRALLACAQEQLDGDPVACARAGRLLLENDPLDGEALRLTLLALRREDNHRSLGRVYAAARKEYAAVGVTLPERWQEYLTQPGA